MAEVLGDISQIGQQPAYCFYSPITFIFSNDKSEKEADIYKGLRSALNTLSQTLPWTAGHVIQRGNTDKTTGIFQIISSTPGKTMESQIQKVDRKGLPGGVPSYKELEGAQFPVDMLDDILLIPCNSYGSGMKEYPVFLFKVVFIDGGVIITFSGQGQASDINALVRIVHIFSECCDGKKPKGNLPSCQPEDLPKIPVLGKYEDYSAAAGHYRKPRSPTPSLEALEIKDHGRKVILSSGKLLAPMLSGGVTIVSSASRSSSSEPAATSNIATASRSDTRMPSASRSSSRQLVSRPERATASRSTESSVSRSRSSQTPPDLSDGAKCATFIISKVAQKGLKSIANKQREELAKELAKEKGSGKLPSFVSTDDVMSAWIWICVTRARRNRLDPDDMTNFIRHLDTRPFFGYASVLVGRMTVSFEHECLVKDLNEKNMLGALASRFRSFVAKDAENYARQVVTLTENHQRKDNLQAAVNCIRGLDKNVLVTSWAKLPTKDLDFGKLLGKPKAVRMPKFEYESLGHLLPKDEEGNIALMLPLRDKDLRTLLDDEKFTKFAKFAPSPEQKEVFLKPS